MDNKVSLNFIDLFAGAGGLSEGFLKEGFNSVAHIEMMKDACYSLKTREVYYYLLKNNQIDIYYDYLKGKITREELYSFTPSELLNKVINLEMKQENLEQIFNLIDKKMQKNKIPQIDIIIGGPPCQAYSLVGRAVKGKERISKDVRNKLYNLYCEFLKKYKPSLFVFENVPGLLTASNGFYINDIKRLINEYNYEMDFKVLNAKDFGVLQNRKRVIIIGWRKDLNLLYPSFNIINHKYNLSSIFEDLPILYNELENNNYRTNEINNYLHSTGIRTKNDILTLNITRKINHHDKLIYKYAIEKWNNSRKRILYNELPKNLKTHKNEKSFLDRFKVVADDLPTSQTIMAHISKDGHYFIHPDVRQLRSLTIREAARIQSFPDNYYFEGSRTSAFTQIGNAVPPLMSEQIAKKIKEMIQ